MFTLKENFSLRTFNTFGLSVNAKVFSVVKNIDDLKTLLEHSRYHSTPILILGGGSNILFTKDFDGIVIYPDIPGIEITDQDEDYVWVKAYAGENWDGFVSYCVSKNWGGIENLSFIPGKIGACPIQNIGAYGVEVKDSIYNVEALEIATGNIHYFNSSQCEFGYRDSIFKSKVKNLYVIVSVTFKLFKKPVLQTSYHDVAEAISGSDYVNVQTIRDAIIKIRKRKLPDPELIGNAGSFFKNPVISASLFESLLKKYPNISYYPAENGMYKVPAASLIEKCGWKGHRDGSVGTFNTQPLVIINYGEAKGIDIYNYALKIQQSVLDCFGVKIEMEVNIL